MPWAWLLALPVVLVVAWVAGLVVLGPLTAQFTVQHLAYRVLPPACAVWAALTILLAIAVPALRRRKPSLSGTSGRIVERDPASVQGEIRPDRADTPGLHARLGARVDPRVQYYLFAPKGRAERPEGPAPLKQ
ncbi:hypothetical protein [Microbacterium elymi]|uniref:Poly-beta-1,6-N-acetyl-D-glucosamine biosynthesis protein PgaD n=1 Tax=Microbacterium elymi TaxID=2909587 RepID=A0ABY5NNK5_9MICO|nr:hypothetical protein [Microbacterium elymi]UUT36748.1 hypothetical protein L2X98_33215 [Microbacterium elymi]